MQKADTVPVKAVLSNFQKGGEVCYRLIPKRTKGMTQEEFVKMYAEANQDEGIFLEDVDTHAALTDKATILANDNLSVRFSFDEIPSDKTKARLVILTRNGESKDEYGVIRLERLVEIKHANA